MPKTIGRIRRKHAPIRILLISNLQSKHAGRDKEEVQRNLLMISTILIDII